MQYNMCLICNLFPYPPTLLLAFACMVYLPDAYQPTCRINISNEAFNIYTYVVSSKLKIIINLENVWRLQVLILTGSRSIIVYMFTSAQRSR